MSFIDFDPSDSLEPGEDPGESLEEEMEAVGMGLLTEEDADSEDGLDELEAGAVPSAILPGIEAAAEEEEPEATNALAELEKAEKQYIAETFGQSDDEKEDNFEDDEYEA